jgi:hypothetical protein
MDPGAHQPTALHGLGDLSADGVRREEFADLFGSATDLPSRRRFGLWRRGRWHPKRLPNGLGETLNGRNRATTDTLKRF